MIELSDVWFAYESEKFTRKNWDLYAIDLLISSGEYVAIMGANGSGKSTLARVISGLLLPSEGRMSIDEQFHTNNTKDIWQIRQRVSMIFQNPDNQIVGPSVADDVAFGMENMGVPLDEMKVRMKEVLAIVGLQGMEDTTPHQLSGGQKQRLSIACMLAMQTDALVLDEATSMLDSNGKAEVMGILTHLHEQGKTILHITHSLQEALQAERIIVMDQGRIVLDMKTTNILNHVETLQQYGIELSDSLRLVHRLQGQGWDLSLHSVQVRDVVNEICKYLLKT